MKPGTTIEVVTPRKRADDRAQRHRHDRGGGHRQAAVRGLGADVKAREYSDKQGEGRVMKQDPLNDKVKPGATVQITISKARALRPD